MPQATDELRDEWGEDDRVSDKPATDWLLARGFTFSRGGIIRPPVGYVADEKTERAIDFMCQEWDYAYETTPAHEGEQG